MNSNDIEVFTPKSFIAGSLPVGKKSEIEESVYHAAAGLLDNERIFYIYSIEGSRVYYLAACADDFSGFSSAVYSDMVSSLPGIPGHQEDGVYISRYDVTKGRTYQQVVIKKDSNLSAHTIPNDKVEEFLEEQDINEIYYLDNVDEKVILTSGKWVNFNFNNSKKKMKYEAMASYGLVFISIMMLIGSVYLDVFSSKLRVHSENVVNNINKENMSLVKQLKGVSELDVFISKSNYYTATLREVGGWIEKAELNGRFIDWVFIVPSWVSDEQIKKLGLSKTEKKGRLIIGTKKEIIND